MLHLGIYQAESLSCPECMQGFSVDFIKKLSKRLQCKLTSAAVESGSVAALRYLHETGCAWGQRIQAVAARRGHLACLQYLKDQVAC